MRRNNVSLAGIFIDPFIDYLAPQTADSFSSDRDASVSGTTTLNSEKLCLLIFVFAFVFVAAVSPILCFGSLFIKLDFDCLWYFWLITFCEIGYSVWLLMRKIMKK